MKNKDNGYNEYDLANTTWKQIEKEKLWRVAKEDFDTTYAKTLRGDNKRIEKFRKRTIRDFNKTHNIDLFLRNLKILAIASGKKKQLASKTKTPSIYYLLLKGNNHGVNNFINAAKEVGVYFKAA